MELFDKRIPQLSNTSSYQDYEDVKALFPELDQGYVFNVSCIERRAIFQDLYNLSKDYLDKNFCDEIRIPGKFEKRYWELSLCASLLKSGHKLKKLDEKRSLPDFCIEQNDGSLIWIEAVSPSPGIGFPAAPVLTPGRLYSKTSSIPLANQNSIPRITQAINDKFKDISNYDAPFSNDDILVTALYTGEIAHEVVGSWTYEETLYSMGMPYIKISTDGSTKESGRTYAPNIEKKNGSEIELGIFLNEKFASISAVVISERLLFSNDQLELLEKLRIYHNLRAKNSLDPGLLKFGVHYKIETDGENLLLKEI